MMQAPLDDDDEAATYACSICGKAFSSKRRLSGHRIGKHVRRPGFANLVIVTDHLTEAQKGYLAGFLDGEGGIQITSTTRPDREYTLALHPTVYFTNTNKTAIDTIRSWLHARAAVCKRQREECSDCYVLSITGTRNIKQLLTCLMPYLIIKAERARVMTDYCDSRLSHLRSGDRRFNDREVTLYTTLKAMNRRGGAAQRQRTDR